MEAAGVPVDAGDLVDEVVVRALVPDKGVNLRPQGLHGAVEVMQIDLLVGLEPGPLVVKADAPHEVHRLVGKAGKHGLPPFPWLKIESSIPQKGGPGKGPGMDFRPKRWYDEVMLPIHIISEKQTGNMMKKKGIGKRYRTAVCRIIISELKVRK